MLGDIIIVFKLIFVWYLGNVKLKKCEVIVFVCEIFFFDVVVVL